MSERAKAPTRGKQTLSALLLSAGLVLGTGAAASAQGFAGTFFDDDILPPRVVAWRLADRGFTNLSRPRFDGRVYVVDAVGPAGLPVRLVLDPATGAIINRRPLPGAEVYARLERPPVRTMPGYGWTEDDASPAPRPLPQEPDPAARLPRRLNRDTARLPETNPLGLNPDGMRRPEPPRKVARTAPAAPPEKTLSKVSPLAPAPKVAPEKAAPEPAASTPAANAKPPSEPETAAREAPETGSKPVAQAAPKPEWKDPPEGKRPVRVIGGATVVPGTPEKDGEAAQPAQ